MPVYFAIDMHLRLDRPDRGRRLARWVETLNADDTLYLVGDICDFWFAARQLPHLNDPSTCEGLSELAAFRSRGGELNVLTGNHDLWLGDFYARALGATCLQEPLDLTVHGLRLRLVHGHRVGGRQAWKAGMESRAFLTAFTRLPAAVADRLDHLLDRSNDRGRSRDEARLVEVFRQYAAGVQEPLDLAIFGHVHAPLDDRQSTPRMVVLGGWHRGASYLKIDENGAELVVERLTSNTVS